MGETPDATGPLPRGGLSRDKLSRLIRKLGGEKRAGGGGIERLPRSGPKSGGADRFPTSFAQRRLWLLHRLDPGSTAYHMPGAVELRGRLDLTALGRSLAEVVRRHEALRTVFETAEGGEPVQVVTAWVTRELPVADLSRLDPAARAAAARGLERGASRRPFDLASGPLLRAVLLRLGADRHRLLLVLHHAVADGWSLGILLRELAACYRAFAGGGRPALPEPPVQVADFAGWQRRRVESGGLDRRLAEFRRHLAGLPVLELPADRPRPAGATSPAGRVPVSLPGKVAGALGEAARRRGTTLFAAVAALFAALLGRWSGRRDFPVGTPVAGRRRPEVQGVIGFFVNTLVLRHDLSVDTTAATDPDGPPFAALLARTGEEVAAAESRQEVPFERLVEVLRPGRRADANPLFQVMLVFEPERLAPVSLPGVRFEPRELNNDAAKVDLVLELRGGGADGAVDGAFEYDRDLFDATTVRRLGRGFERLASAFAADPERAVFAAGLLAPAERHQLLVEWNDTPSPPAPELFHRLFAERAARRPEAVAAAFGDHRLSYRELDRRANRLAHRLRRSGIGPERLVGICLDRSLEVVTAILAVLKAGGAWLPLDPAYPRRRLADTVADSGVGLIVTGAEHRGALPETGVPRIELDAETQNLAAENDAPPAELATPGNLAYVIYTSGSTGRPKGVGVPHRGFHALVAAQRRLFDVGPGDRVLQLASLNFDASASEIGVTLGVGATLQLASRDDLLPGPPLADLLRRQRITAVTVPPSALAAIREDRLPREGFPALRVLVVAGEACPLELARRWAPGRRFVDAYGPTETTVCATGGRWDGGPRLSIGRPIAGARVHLLDRRGRAVPLGVPGELCAGGAGVARGYLGRPALTAERFVPDPHGGDPPGGRLYRTGDLARFLATGEIDFLGRIDHQVKVRGFRIEPGEVETALLATGRVRDAAVVAWSPGGDVGERRLVAWVTPAGETGDPAAVGAELRERLRERLPEHVVPSAVAVVGELPLLPNGKVDRAGLSRRRPPEVAGEGGSAAPRTATEELLHGIFREVLGVERVGIHDDFFALGGHSLLATRVASRIREAFGVELPLRRLFEAPTVAALAGEVERAGSASGLPAPPPLLRRGTVETEAEELQPLSFAQERLWFLEELHPGGAVYNVPTAVRLRGPLRVAAFRAALAAVVGRHESLRTTFEAAGAEPRQRIHRPGGRVGSPPVPVVDLAALPAPVAGREGARLARADARRPFDLGHGPLLRATLVRSGGERHLLLLNLHHAVADGWSVGVLLRELGELYAAAVAGRRPALPALPVQYADYALWQRGWLDGEALERRIAYWRDRLRGVPVLELPTDRPRPPVAAHRGTALPVALPEGLAHDLAELARRRGATLFMTLLAGFATLLGRLAGQRDVAVGAPIANRNRLEAEGLIGFFVNTQVHRVDLGAATAPPTFAELLAHVRGVALEADAHQDLPFEKVVAELAPERRLSTTPLFQVMLALQNAPFGPLELPGLELEPEDVDSGTAKFDLTLNLRPEPRGGLVGMLEYDRDLFDRTTVQRWARSYRRLLRAAVAAPETAVDDLPAVGRSERHQLLVEWQGHPLDAPPATLAELFEARAARVPDRAAVVRGGAVVSYGALHRRAEHLARRLREVGVGAETVVGVCLDRTPELVAVILAVHKAGGAYLPLDPGYPEERLRFLLEDSGASVVVTRRGAGERLPGFGGATVELDRLPVSGEESPLPPGASSQPGPDHLSHLIYTSGSTGRPKGVAIEHRSAVALLRWAHGAFAAAELERVLAATSINFDLSIFELFATLTAGGTVVLAENALELPALEGRERVTLLNTVPSAATELARVGGLPPGVRTVNLAGEPLRRSLVERLHGALPGARVLNLYGPSEDTTYSTFTAVSRGDGEPTIGRPVAGTRGYLLDPGGRPVPLGAVGDLHLGGAGLARGYLGRPGLTAERFVPDGISGDPGARLYRTGDRVRQGADGELRFLGRADHQVKIRGFRVEPGEVEARLLALPEVAQAVVVAFGAEGGVERRLVAYLSPGPGRRVDPGALRSALGETLPGYMVPSSFVVLDALPLLPNGKVDRRALPAPGEEGLGPAGAPPRNATEELLVEIFRDLLGRERVGIHDGFFDLGGHSLLATRAASRIREVMGVELPLRQLFETPTAAGLAAAVEAREPGREPAPPILPRGPEAGDELPLSFAQERLWILDRFEPENPAYNMPFPVRLRGTLDPAALRWSLRRLVERHESLRTTFHSRGGKPVQRIAPELPLELPRIDLSELDPEARGRERERWTREASLAPFDLERGPLLRAWLLRLGPEEHTLAFTVHHSVCDGWSLGVLIRELGAFYRSAVAGVDPGAGLPPATLQYADYALWQRRWLSGEVLERQLAAWRRRLDPPPPPLELPTDRPRPAVRSFEGGSRQLEVEPALAERLREVGRRRGTTLFMTLLAAFDLLLHRLSGQGDLAVGTPIAGRNRSETEGMVGIFLNTLVLRSELDRLPEPTFAALLDQVRERTLEAYAHQDLPFEKLLDELQPERDLSRTPLIQVFFNMINLPLEPLDLGALVIEPESVPEPPSKFDVTVYVQEEAGGIRFSAVYNALLFDGARIEEMLRQYWRLLERVAGDPAVPLRDLDLRTEAAEPILPDPTEPLGDAFRGSVVELFHRRADEHPHRIAVADPRGAWSYAELRRRASRIARRLAGAGLQPGEVVAILAHRGATLVAAVYGTLEAGGAFLLMDFAYPGPRLAEIVEAARPRAFLALAEPPPELDAAVADERPRLRLAIPPWGAGGEDPTAAGPGLDAPVEVTAGDLAYLSFTSGSTGKPKGIEGRHGPLTHFLPWQCRRFDLGESDRYSMLSGLAHDPLQRDLFTPLATGATLLVPAPDQLFAAGYLASWLAAERVTVAHLTPAMAQIVTEMPAAGGAPSRVPSLRRAFLTGEALTWRDVTRLRRLAPGVLCVNFYGSTETQRAVGYCEASADGVLERGGHDGKEILPLGRGMEDVQLLVVNPEGRLAGVGELGEVWVRSPHLARGYLGDPALTADRFRRNPWGDDPADRVYRTGDLGRYLPDGRVAFAGRTDFQAQIRGYRVEPGEVEAALARIDGVWEAVVLVRGDGSETRRLVAHLAREPGAAGETLTIEAVRRWLRAELPAYMVPEGYLLLDRLPLTPNGKVDRAALGRMREETGGAGGYRAPETALERSLVELLKELLELERVGVEDNFFDLGANSLLLVRFHSRLQELLGRELPAMELFNHPTVRSLAAVLGGSEEREAAPARPVADRGGSLKTGRERLRRLQRRRRS